MADFVGNKKRLSINLSIFSPNNDQNSSSKSGAKSPKSFEPNGVVGLGILAAMSESDLASDPCLSAKPSRAALLAVSPRSTPIPIGSVVNYTSKSAAKFGAGGSNLGEEEMEMELSEEYTCVISHVGKEMIKKREYFDDDSANNNVFEKTTNYRLGSNPPPPRRLNSDVPAMSEAFRSQDFLNFCDLCNKNLHGLDIFMYRGEKAFCSAECRCKQMTIDERREKQKLKQRKRASSSGTAAAMKAMDYPGSPCSNSPMQFFVGVAAA